MNFLAHIYLSGNHQQVQIGNFIADGIRGNHFQHFSHEIKKGIMLHREIDTFTDNHAVFRMTKHRLHEEFGHYSGVIVDIFYDHFLAKNWMNYHQTPLDEYVQNFYELLANHEAILPPKIQQLLPVMTHQNWLLSYATVEGIGQILKQMDQRTKNVSKMKNAHQALWNYYQEIEDEFTIFFEDLRQFCHHWLLEQSNESDV
jgi:acyl carrier protein phosphodiesterase